MHSWHYRLGCPVALGLGLLLGANGWSLSRAEGWATTVDIPAAACHWGPLDNDDVELDAASLANIGDDTLQVNCPVAAFATKTSEEEYGFGYGDLETGDIQINAVSSNKTQGVFARVVVTNMKHSYRGYSICPWTEVLPGQPEVLPSQTAVRLFPEVCSANLGTMATLQILLPPPGVFPNFLTGVSIQHVR